MFEFMFENRVFRNERVPAGRMSESEYEDGSGDDGQAMETDSLEDLRVRRCKSAVLFTVLTVALIA